MGIPSSASVDAGKKRPMGFVRKWCHNFGHASPLENRAWTFQKFMLSTRIVEFINQDFTLCCGRGEFCECAVISYLRDSKPQTLNTPYGIHRLLLSMSNNASVPKSVYCKVWLSIVHWYLGRSRTMHTDQLTTLSGLAVDRPKARKNVICELS
jgi:hypothetical protein